MRAPALALLLAAAAGLARAQTPGAPQEVIVDEVTVVAPEDRRTSDPTRDAAEISGDALRGTARASALEAVSQETAGVYVSGRGALHGVSSGATGGIHIRGLGGSPNSQVLVVEDGVPDYQGIFGHPIPDAYVPALLAGAEVVKGGDSVLFGTNAMSGVVVLRSRWLEREGAEVASDLAGGSFATVRGTVSVLSSAPRLDVAAALHQLTTEGHREGAGGSLLVGATALRLRAAPGLALTYRAKAVHLEGADPGPVTHPTPDHTYDVWRAATSLRLDWEAGPAQVTVLPHLNVGLHRLYDGFESTDWVAGAEATAALRPAPWLDALLGGSADRVGGTVEDRLAGTTTRLAAQSDLSAFGQATLRPLDGVSTVAGVRLLHSTRWGTVPLFKAGLRWAPAGGLELHTRIARNFRQPTLRELFLPFPTANPALRPERALTWDVGAEWRLGRVELAVAGYRTEASDLIKYFGVWPSAEVVNIDRVVVWGVEGSAAVRGIGPFSATASGDLQDVGRYTRQNPSAKVNVGIEAGHRTGPHELRATLGGEWVHGLYMADYSRRPQPDVTSLDLALRYRRRVSPGTLLEPYLVLRNLLNRTYAYVEGYVMPGFNALLGLKVTVE